jgi:hypothetical protein
MRLLLHIWSGCGGLLNEVSVADMKRSRRGDAPDRALSRCSSINAKPFGCSNAECCRVHWARHSMHGSSELDRGLLYVVQTAFGRVVECGRVKCA